MVLILDTLPPPRPAPAPNAGQQHEALLRALRRMGFHDPEALAGPAPTTPPAGQAPAPGKAG